jgi:uncharacterized protein
MANIDRHPPGGFCWVELATTDQNAAKQFYGSLLGWAANDSPMGPGKVYTTFELRGRGVAACYTLEEQMRAQGVPPHWGLYVATADASETAAKASQAGGTVIAGPFDVMDYGRMAVLQDPTGAFFCAWQAKTHPGITVAGEPGAFCWADLLTPDAGAASAFYRAVFGWEFDPGKDGSGYLHIKNGSEMIGGVPPARHIGPGVPPHWQIYYMVSDCDGATAKARELGANVCVEPMTMEGVGRWAVMSDPQGAYFALFAAPAEHA